MNEWEILPATDPRGVVRKGNPVSIKKGENARWLTRDSGHRVESEAASFDVRWLRKKRKTDKARGRSKIEREIKEHTKMGEMFL